MTNDSDAPVQQVEVRFGVAYNSSEAHEVLGNGMPDDRLAQLVDLIGPHQAVRFVSQRYSSAAVHNNPPVLFFSDENGARWALDRRGDLKPNAKR
ncbi:hypothetical protein ACF09H_06960 [Streptomyces sp. NPDC014983]|uniref:hypothetical protein n=1 Tax=Streptomyces sp. NPDC014983 TaxID=3364933 RepID=UPI0036F96E37